MRLPLCFKIPYFTLIPDSYPVHLEARTQVTTERGGMGHADQKEHQVTSGVQIMLFLDLGVG